MNWAAAGAAVVSLLNSLPKILDLVDKFIGAINKWQDNRRIAALDKRIESRNTVKRELESATDEKAKRAALRKLVRIG